MEFNSATNKAMLWELISETGIFDSVANTMSKSELITVFESSLIDIHRTELPLHDKNKRFLDDYVSKLKNYKQEYKQEDLQKQREGLFEERLKMKQLEFKQFAPAPPPKITFLDPVDTFEVPKNQVSFNHDEFILSELREIKGLLHQILRK
jgi:hypothetical protein